MSSLNTCINVICAGCFWFPAESCNFRSSGDAWVIFNHHFPSSYSVLFLILCNGEQSQSWTHRCATKTQNLPVRKLLLISSVIFQFCKHNWCRYGHTASNFSINNRFMRSEKPVFPFFLVCCGCSALFVEMHHIMSVCNIVWSRNHSNWKTKPFPFYSGLQIKLYYLRFFKIWQRLSQSLSELGFKQEKKGQSLKGLNVVEHNTKHTRVFVFWFFLPSFLLSLL